ncbi:hypothetical protein TSUD_379460 [Trifolium subterraneum]|uniref:Aminotransferase-like plant mobile domain-containing protein n=1 Tax=Trifolium subterraneum TaxID=3900 RepID=A0A2Z6MB79_TRISU|nr:hypothetical protein TSUD_379460 [Trifolium subterraneum]
MISLSQFSMLHVPWNDITQLCTEREATLERSKRKVAGTSTSRAEVEEAGTSTLRAEVEEAEAQHPVAEKDVEAQGDVEADEQEEEQPDEQEKEQRSDAEEDQFDEAEPPPPPAPKQTKRNRRTTTARNPPKVAEPQVTEFGGGPSHLSLLSSFGNHVAAALWRGETNYNHVGSGLLTAFTERWQPETGTFHLPIGEMTITLDDVSCLLHISITGKMMNHAGTSCTMEEGRDMCDELLNFSREDAQEEFDKMKGAHVSFAKLLDIYHGNLNSALEAENNDDEEPETVEFLRDCTVRAFLLYLISGTLCTNESAQYVDVIFLSYLQDIPLINTWNWGASGLAYMYNYLDRASRRRCGNHGGYNCMNFCAFQETRTSLDRMEVDEVTFCPYEDHRQTRPFQDISWYSGWIMCGSAMLCPHLPERVLRQYGNVQAIPRAPSVSAKPDMNQFSIQDAFDDYLTENYVTEEMRGPRAEHGYETEPGQLLEKVYNDLEHVVTYSLHRKRKRDSGDGKKKKKKKSKTRGEEAGPSGQG